MNRMGLCLSFVLGMTFAVGCVADGIDQADHAATESATTVQQVGSGASDNRSAAHDQSVEPDFVECGDDCGGGGGGGGGGGVPATAVRLTGFHDSGFSGNYYEIRQYFDNFLDQNVGYNSQKWDGDAMANGTFQPQVVASSIPCGGHITLDIGRIGYFNTWERVTAVFSISAPGSYTFHNDGDPYKVGVISYSWNGCN